MRRLHKRWEPVKTAYGPLYRIFLTELKPKRAYTPISWACIEFTDPKGPFQLEIWQIGVEEWGLIDHFPTLKQAKAVGRLLASIALTKNI